VELTFEFAGAITANHIMALGVADASPSAGKQK
jgi:hypothetical protein